MQERRRGEIKESDLLMTAWEKANDAAVNFGYGSLNARTWRIIAVTSEIAGNFSTGLKFGEAFVKLKIHQKALEKKRMEMSKNQS